MPICILGMHRSGTSMVARMLRDCGVFLGPEADIMPAVAKDNPEGYWENLNFVEINDDILKALGGTWDNPPALEPGWSQRPEIAPFKVRALGVLKQFEGKGTWGWKDPRSMLTVEFWQAVIPDLQFLICLRNPIEVAQSFEKRPAHGLQYHAALDLWGKYHDVSLQSVDPTRALVTHQSSFFYDPVAEMLRVADFFELQLSEPMLGQVTGTIKTDLRRNVISDAVLRILGAPANVRQQYEGLKSLCGPVFVRLEADRDYHTASLVDTVEALQETAAGFRRAAANSDRLASEAATRERDLRANLARAQQETSIHVTSLRERIAKRLAQNEEAIRIHFAAFRKHIGHLHEERERLRAHYEAHIEGLNAQIADIQNRSNELASRYGALDRILNRLLPRGSFARRAAGKLFRGARVLRHEGPRGVMRRIASRAQDRREQLLPSTGDDDTHPGKLFFNLETNLSAPVEAIHGTVVLLRGWCYHSKLAIREIEIVADGEPHPVRHHSLTRFDVLQAMERHLTSRGNALNSGFWTLLSVSPAWEPKCVGLAARVVLADGSQQFVEIGDLGLVVTPDVALNAASDLVAICMTTFNPKPALFSKQVESIRAQTHTNWVCLVNDDGSDPVSLATIEKVLEADARFRLVCNPERLGFYRNFEAVLRRVPANTAYVALSDQDDEWSPEKLALCLGAMSPGVSLVYSDMRLVAEDGRVLSKTYWIGRKNNYEHLDCLLLGNTITGAASLFRSELLKTILPFPERIDSDYHDHWIATAALASGEIAYIPEPLYDYTQHADQVVGRWKPTRHSLWEGIRDIVRWWKQPMAARCKPHSALAGRALHAWWPQRMAYWSALLLQRARPTGTKARVLRRYAHATDGLWRAFAAACLASMRGSRTLGLQWLSFNGLLAQRLLRRFTVRRRPAVLDALRKIWGLEEAKPTPAAGQGLEAAYGNVRFIPKKTAPLTLVPSASTAKRVNLLTSTIDFKYFFGGYFAVFSLALKLADLGVKVRLVLTDPVDYKPDFWREEIKKYHGLANFFDRIEVEPNFERQPLDVSPRDQFIATSWWTAFIAHDAAKQLGRERFIYMSQDFEPLFHAANSFYALALESYALPHYALFSSPLLQDYSRTHGIGVYAEGREQGDANSTPFMNAIEARTPTRAQIDRKGAKRLLFYARPEDHANRNCFPLGVLAMQQAIREGHFKPGEWELHGIGSVNIWGSMDLGENRQLHLLPKLSLDEYYALIPEYDLGLALMLTPHPSLVPLDMAASGLVTVTNTFDVKTRDRLLAISSNLVPVEPTIEGIKAGLIAAAARVNDLDARLAGAKLDWARNWDEAFDEPVMAKLKSWTER